MYISLQAIIRISTTVIISLVLYFSLLKPLRVYINEMIIYPAFLCFYSNNIQVIIPEDNKFATIIKNIELNNRVKVKMPFGKWWLIPMCVLLGFKSRVMIKKFTLYHVFITLLDPTIIATIIIDYVWVSSLNQPLYALELILAFLFILIEINKNKVKSHLGKFTKCVIK